jgi:hypothetical protein
VCFAECSCRVVTKHACLCMLVNWTDCICGVSILTDQVWIFVSVILTSYTGKFSSHCNLIIDQVCEGLEVTVAFDCSGMCAYVSGAGVHVCTWGCFYCDGVFS